MGSSHISIKEVKLDHFGEIEGGLFAKVPIVPGADVDSVKREFPLCTYF